MAHRGYVGRLCRGLLRRCKVIKAQAPLKNKERLFMSVSMCKHVFCVDLKRTHVDLMQVENRRFMYHPSGLLIMGEEGTAGGNQLRGSHAEEYHVASERYVLPPYDDFIRGWIGVGGGYPNGIIHFGPCISADNMVMFEKAFDFIEIALENGFGKDAVLRGFPGKWEQAIGSVIPDVLSVDTVLKDARSRCGGQERDDSRDVMTL